MSLKSTRLTIATALSVALLAAGASAQAAPIGPYVLPSRTSADFTGIAKTSTPPNSVSVDAASSHKDYSKNSVTGAYTPPKPSGVAAVLPVVKDPGFQWADAAAGAGIALGLMTLLGTGALLVRRHRATPPVATG